VAILIASLNWSLRVIMTSFKSVGSKVFAWQNVFIFKMSINGVGSGASLITWMHDLQGICKMVGSCLITWSMLMVGQLWFVMCTILPICKVTTTTICDMQFEDTKDQQIIGQSLMKQCWSTGFQNQILRDSWLIVHKPIRTW